MFALAIWDRRSQRLILARDRLGKKPLYYAATATAFLFGSEIKAVLAWPGLSRTADLSAIDSYLTFGYVPAPQTAFDGIRKLPAAHYLVLEALPDGSLGGPELVRYWRLPGPRGVRHHRSVAELRRELVAQLEEAVRLRLISDVPLGAFLSGGAPGRPGGRGAEPGAESGGLAAIEVILRAEPRGRRFSPSGEGR